MPQVNDEPAHDEPADDARRRQSSSRFVRAAVGRSMLNGNATPATMARRAHVTNGPSAVAARRSTWHRGLVPLGHLVLVRGERCENLLLLLLGHVQGVHGAPEFGRDLVELRWRDVQVAMGFLETQVGAAGPGRG
jgi:hypothetical protein